MEEHTRSVVSFGNGHAVVMPAKWIRDLNISKGDMVYMRVTKDGELVVRCPVEWERRFDSTDLHHHATINYICLDGGEAVKEVKKSVVKFGDGYLVVLPNSWVQYFELSGDDKVLIGVNKNMELVIKVSDLKRQFNVERERMRQEDIRRLMRSGKEMQRYRFDVPMVVCRTDAKDEMERINNNAQI